MITFSIYIILPTPKMNISSQEVWYREVRKREFEELRLTVGYSLSNIIIKLRLERIQDSIKPIRERLFRK